MRRHIKYPSTPRFAALYTTVASMTDKKERLAFAKYDPDLGIPPTDEQKELLNTFKPNMPIITFTGTEKLHGENMAVCFNDGELWVQGRNQVRTLLGDQNGMAGFVEATKDKWQTIIDSVASKYSIDTTTHTVVVDCEWAGGNIQRGNAACSGTDKAAYIFDHLRVVDNTTNETLYISTYSLTAYPQDGIYLMSQFGRYNVTLDFSNPAECETNLIALAESIEANSPIAKYFNKPDNVGEGVYLTAMYNGELLTLKAKGEKHGGKPKQKKVQAPLSSEEEAIISNFAKLVTPVWRLTQAITEVNATEMKHIGMVIKWVILDILKEEEEAIAKLQPIEFKQTQRAITDIVKDYYRNYLKDL